MRILDRYILTELAGPFLFGIAAFSSIFVGTDVLFRMAKYVTQNGASLLTVTKLFLYSMPAIVVLTFPMSMLLASLLSFGRLSGSSEIVAMRNGGLSFARLAAPVFIASIIVSIGSVVVNETIVPFANTEYSRIIREEIQNNKMTKSQQHIVIKNMKGDQMERLMYAHFFDAASNTMREVDVQQFQNGKLSTIIRADNATWDGSRWTMKNGVLYYVDDNGTIDHYLSFHDQVLPVERTPQQISWEQKNLDDMSMRELKMLIQIRTMEHGKTDELVVKLHQRVAIPLASMVFAFIGAPLGLQPHRSSSAIGLGLSIVIIFVYYGVMTLAGSLGEGGAIPPVLGAWLPDILGVAGGTYLTWRVAK